MENVEGSTFQVHWSEASTWRDVEGVSWKIFEAPETGGTSSLSDLQGMKDDLHDMLSVLLDYGSGSVSR